jgi:hypothetical protein
MKFKSCIGFFLLLFAAHPAWAEQGWYLIVPPPTSGNNIRIFTFSEEREFLVGEFNKNAPLPKWIQLKSFDSAKECEEYKINKMHFWIDGFNEETGEAKIREHIEASRCIASDDPRLK